MVLATPVRHIVATIPGAAARMKLGSVLIDLGSTKANVVRAMNSIPQGSGVAAIGGHPMCGKEVGGLESARCDSLQGRDFRAHPHAAHLGRP